MAYLGGRVDLVPAETLAKLESPPDVKPILRRDMGGIIAAARQSFTKVRQAALSKLAPATTTQRHRVGRNDPCPCGWGKKYKRCCIDRGPALDEH